MSKKSVSISSVAILLVLLGTYYVGIYINSDEGKFTQIDKYLFKDKEHVYAPPVKGDYADLTGYGNATTTIPGADPSTFYRISNVNSIGPVNEVKVKTWTYYADKEHVYYFEYFDGIGGERISVERLKADPDSFVAIEENELKNGQSVDAIAGNKLYFYLGKVVGSVGDIDTVYPIKALGL